MTTRVKRQEHGARKCEETIRDILYVDRINLSELGLLLKGKEWRPLARKNEWGMTWATLVVPSSYRMVRGGEAMSLVAKTRTEILKKAFRVNIPAFLKTLNK